MIGLGSDKKTKQICLIWSSASSDWWWSAFKYSSRFAQQAWRYGIIILRKFSIGFCFFSSVSDQQLISIWSAQDQSAWFQGSSDRDARNRAVLDCLGLRQLSGAVVLSSFCMVVICSSCMVVICTFSMLWSCRWMPTFSLRAQCLSPREGETLSFFFHFFWKLSDS